MESGIFQQLLNWHLTYNRIFQNKAATPHERQAAEEFGRFLSTLTPEDVSGVDERIKREIADGTARRAREGSGDETTGEAQGEQRQAQ